MMNQQDLDTLRELRRNKHLIPFVGAGMSMSLGLPSWTQLIDFIARELDYDPEVFRLSGDNLQLAEYYVEVYGSIGRLRSELDRLFALPDEDIRASRSHEALVRLELPLIYTTNFDRIIETAFDLHGPGCYVIGNIDDIMRAPQGVTQVVKFHGTFSDDDSLVLTESSYFDRLGFESALDIKLRADILGKCLLFIGYSLKDINIRFMLYKLSKLREQMRSELSERTSSYMLTFSANEVQRKLLKAWGVRVIELDPMDMPGSTAEFLESLR